VDNVLRFVQARLRGCPPPGRMAVGPWATSRPSPIEMGVLQGANPPSGPRGRVHHPPCRQVTGPADDYTDPADFTPSTTSDAPTEPPADIGGARHLPGRGPRCRPPPTILPPVGSVGQRPLRTWPVRVQEDAPAHKELQDIIAILGLDEPRGTERGFTGGPGPARIQRFLFSPAHVSWPKNFTRPRRACCTPARRRSTRSSRGS